MNELVTAPASAEAIAAALARGTGFVEAGVQPSPLVAEAGGLAVTLSTAAAYRLPLVPLLASAALARFGVDAGLRLPLELALQEALANAIVHGNLAIGPTASLDDRFARIEAGLADPGRAALRIEVTMAPLPGGGVEAAVADQGAGFDLAAALSRPAPTEASSGRGLAMIKDLAARVAAEDGGRRIRFTIAP
jgi:anti-sigma regulatory factor (Ser/Thr protein kinase)